MSQDSICTPNPDTILPCFHLLTHGMGSNCLQPTLSPFFPFIHTFWYLASPPPFHRLEYKYSKLVMNTTLKDCDLPAADSCAIMEGEDVEDDLIFTSKKSLFGKIKSFTSKVGDQRTKVSLKGWRGHHSYVNPALCRDHYCAPNSPYYSIPHPKILPSAFCI